MAYEQENRTRRRLFEHFEQRIGRWRFEIVGGIDDHHTALGKRRRERQYGIQPADLIDAYAAGTRFGLAIGIGHEPRGSLVRQPHFALDQLVIGMAARRDQPGRGVVDIEREIGAAEQIGARLGKQFGGNGLGKARLADAARAVKQPAVVQPTAIDRRPHGRELRVMPEDRQSKSPIEASSRAVTDSGGPEASMVRKRLVS